MADLNTKTCYILIVLGTWSAAFSLFQIYYFEYNRLTQRQSEENRLHEFALFYFKDQFKESNNTRNENFEG